MAQSDTKPSAAPAPRPARLTVPKLVERALAGERLAMLTCYDASFAAHCDAAGVDMLLVGDSLGMVVQGRASTLPVTLADIAYHTRAVVAGSERALVVADRPFGSYQGSAQDAFAAAATLLASGAQMVKMEGGAWLAPTVAFLVERGIPVCAHVGLLPQQMNTQGGYRVQGKTPDAADALVADARALAAAGAAMLVAECVPRAVGGRLAREAGVPVIGIGAGPECHGQVLVIYDAIGVTPGKAARFVRDFSRGAPGVAAAIAAYVAAVRDGSFPAPEHCF